MHSWPSSSITTAAIASPLADAALAPHAPVPQWTVESVLLSPDLANHLLAPLEHRDNAAAAACSGPGRGCRCPPASRDATLAREARGRVRRQGGHRPRGSDQGRQAGGDGAEEARGARGTREARGARAAREAREARGGSPEGGPTARGCFAKNVRRRCLTIRK